MNSLNVRPASEPKTIYVNINRVSKLINSKQGIMAAKRHEDNMRLIDYWHPESAAMIEQEAEQSLYRVIDNLFGNESQENKAAISAYVKTSTVNKIIAAKEVFKNNGFDGVVEAIDKVLNNITIYKIIQRNSETVENADNEDINQSKSTVHSYKKFKDVGHDGDKVLICAQERDNNLCIVDAVYKEARGMGLSKLNSEQQRTVDQALKQAAAFEKKRNEAALDLFNDTKENNEIAKNAGPEVYRAYQFIYGMPDIGSKKAGK